MSGVEKSLSETNRGAQSFWTSGLAVALAIAILDLIIHLIFNSRYGR
jgi:hypothetical protein